MSDARPYNSPRRALTAAATRRDIIDAARQLFLDRGYAQVTVSDIARAAGTAVKTVYASAGGKAEILSEIVGSAVTGSGARETVERVRETTDAASALAALAHGTRLGNEANRVAIAILYSALPVHESAEAFWEEGTAAYRDALREAAAHLDSLGALGPGADVEKCADLLWFCLGLGAWRTLVNDCGWSWDEAEVELTSVATKLLVKTG
jgi:AcrR family transcriptional regulator